jgi:phage terminase small subunit
LLEIARLAFNDPRKAFTPEGQLKNIQDWPDEVAAAISSIKVIEQSTTDGVLTTAKEIRFWDKNKPLEMAGKHLGMFTDKIQIGGDKNSPIRITLDDFYGRTKP